MPGSEVRFAEQYKDRGFGMPLANLGDLGGGVAITRADFAQVFARHAVEAIDRLRHDRGPRPAIRKTTSSRSPSRDRSGCAGEVRPRQFRAATILRECAGRGRRWFRRPAPPVGRQPARAAQPKSPHSVGPQAGRDNRRSNHVGSMHCIVNLVAIQKRIVGAEGVAVNSRRYLRRLFESWARISRSTPASACNCGCAAARS
jgi:hypothetical protein